MTHCALSDLSPSFVVALITEISLRTYLYILEILQEENVI